LESFSYELQFDMHFYMHSYLHKKNYSCKKWVLQEPGHKRQSMGRQLWWWLAAVRSSSGEAPTSTSSPRSSSSPPLASRLVQWLVVFSEIGGG
jgi:hypothetical protein